MGIVGIGVDIVHIPRIAALLHRRTAQKLASRILSPAEHAQLFNSQLPMSQLELAQSFAVRWSVKEAAYKALHPLVRPTWKELTYMYAGSGKPRLIYHPLKNTDLRSLVGELHVSVSHDGDYVFSTVLAQAPSK